MAAHPRKRRARYTHRMEHTSGNVEAPPVVVPPTVPGSIPAQRSSWPTVLAIVSIVLASLGLLGGIFQMVILFLAPLIYDTVGGQDPSVTAQREVLERTFSMQLMGVLLATLTAALLLYSGVVLYKRRARGVRWSKIWAMIQLFTGLVGVAIGTWVQRLTMAELASAGAAPPPQMGGFVAAMTAAGFLIGLVWAWTYPIFMLVWLNRGKIKAETAQWR